MSLRNTLDELIGYLKNGDVIAGFEKFYGQGVEMRENSGAPTVGFDANLEREKQFVAQVKEWKGLDVIATGVNETGDASGSTFIEYAFEFVNTDDQPVKYEQVAVQTWRDGKVVRERFYYDTGS